MTVLMVFGWLLALMLAVIVIGLSLPDGRRPPTQVVDPPPDTAVRPPLPRRNAWRPVAYVPEHVDPPLSPLDQAETAAAWPHLVSSYLQESHHEHDA